ncbi:MAG: helix-turn-helix domain-containing protein [Reichenbachiella sp.]|uniref:helix-turn-helix domain-containing protein n=1 Tax=Reichenbachiella sp. TaxID=2184521 RepID=UPI00329A3A2C
MIYHKSIAVLPFDNISSDPENEYFSDGMTEELINALSKVEGLKVTARTSSFAFKNKKEDVRIIGNELGVATVLEGSIRKSGEKIRITAQLTRTDNGFHIWSENYDRQLHDIFHLQDEISLLIADKIRENFGHMVIEDQLVDAPTENIEAYELYLKGKYYLNQFNPDDIKKGISLLEESTKLQSDFALAHVNIHYGFNMLAAGGLMPVKQALDIGKSHLDRAIEIGYNLPEYYHSLGWHRLNEDWDFADASFNLLKAIELRPGYADAHQKLFINWVLQGKFEEAKGHIDLAYQLDPLSALNNYFYSYYYYLTEQFQECKTHFEKTFEINPTFLVGYSIYALALVNQKNEQKIFDVADIIPEVNGAVVERQIMYALAYSSLGDQPKTQECMVQLENMLQGESGERVRFFLIYIEVLSGNLEAALVHIEEGVANHEPLMTLLKVDPLLKPLRSESKFQDIIKKVFAKSDDIKQSTPSTVPAIDSEEVSRIVSLLDQLMSNERMYLESDLSLRHLAEAVHIHPNKLSWILNDQMGKNFNEFVNEFRLHEFQQKAVDPANKHLTLLGLAYESGFRSKSVFNDFFKKNTGLTPKAWLKDQG